MRIALIGIHYPPLRSSTAVQLRDLAQEFVLQGHELTVMVPDTELTQPWLVETSDGVQVLRVAAPRIRDIGYFRRTINEMLLPIAMFRAIRKSPFRSAQWEGVVWWSPSIFFGPLIRVLKGSSNCRSYLILRDIFPDWAVDLGLLKKGMAYRAFKLVERYQYKVADIVGVQSPSGLGYLADWKKKSGRRLEVLQNWLSPAPNIGSSISMAATRLSGRLIFAYIGTMGLAQCVDIFLDLAECLISRRDIGFIFVGRGSEVARLRTSAERRALENVLFHPEVDPSEMPGLLAQCHVGLLALDPRHKTSNVPGKFLTYLQAGLPVLARVNANNDLADLIETEGVGNAYIGDSLNILKDLAMHLVDNEAERELMSLRAKALAQNLFSSTVAVTQIVKALSHQS